MTYSILQEAFDQVFLTAKGVHLHWQTTEGQWLWERHPRNDRGDEGTLAKRTKSVEKYGVCDGLREGGWVCPRQSLQITAYMHVFAFHYATLSQALKRARDSDMHNKNLNVQRSLARGCKGCKVHF